MNLNESAAISPDGHGNSSEVAAEAGREPAARHGHGRSRGPARSESPPASVSVVTYVKAARGRRRVPSGFCTTTFAGPSAPAGVKHVIAFGATTTLVAGDAVEGDRHPRLEMRPRDRDGPVARRRPRRRRDRRRSPARSP